MNGGVNERRGISDVCLLQVSACRLGVRLSSAALVRSFAASEVIFSPLIFEPAQVASDNDHVTKKPGQ
jgi:hypothetical protein